MNGKRKEPVRYLYELSVAEGYFKPRDIIGYFTNLRELQELVESNSFDLYEGCFEYAYIEKIPLNRVFPLTKEQYIYHYNETYEKYGLREETEWDRDAESWKSLGVKSRKTR